MGHKTPVDPYAILTIEELKSLLDRVKRNWMSNIARRVQVSRRG